MSLIKCEDVGTDSLDRVNKIFAEFPRKAFTAVGAAAQRAADKAKTDAGRYAAATYNIQKGVFMSKMSCHDRLYGGGEEGVTGVSITFESGMLPLTNFNPKITAHGIRANVRNGGGGVIDRSFANTVNGRYDVFARESSARTPINRLYGIGPGSMMKDEGITEQMVEDIDETFTTRLDHEILRVMNGW